MAALELATEGGNAVNPDSIQRGIDKLEDPNQRVRNNYTFSEAYVSIRQDHYCLYRVRISK